MQLLTYYKIQTALITAEVWINRGKNLNFVDPAFQTEVIPCSLRWILITIHPKFNSQQQLLFTHFLLPIIPHSKAYMP